jgi:2Fe-2S ferredoxin
LKRRFTQLANKKRNAPLENLAIAPASMQIRRSEGLPGTDSASQARPQRQDRQEGIMPKITYIEHNGETHVVEGETGQTVMETAIKHAIPGIVAECGGACSCATCHVYVDEAWREQTGEPSPMEEDMLDFAFEVKPNSRLSCQIRLRPELDGLVVRIPEHQN